MRIIMGTLNVKQVRITARLMCINIWHHHLRDLVNKHVIKLVYCQTENTIADALTKPLSQERSSKDSELKWGLVIVEEGVRAAPLMIGGCYVLFNKKDEKCCEWQLPCIFSRCVPQYWKCSGTNSYKQTFHIVSL